MRQIFSFGVVLETIFPDGVVSKLFPTWGSYLREKHVMQDPNRQNQWRVWCPWANRQRQWRYAHAEAKSPVQMATSLALWEPPVKLASSMDWGCRATSQAMAVQLMDASVQAKPLLPLAVCLAQGLPRKRYYHWRVAFRLNFFCLSSIIKAEEASWLHCTSFFCFHCFAILLPYFLLFGCCCLLLIWLLSFVFTNYFFLN